MPSKRVMKYITQILLSLILFCDLCGRISARPEPVDNESESEDAYYGAEGDPSNDALREDDETPLKDEEPKQAQIDESASPEQEREMKDHVCLHRNAKDPEIQLAADKFADFDGASNEDFESVMKENENSMNTLAKRRAKTYTENSDPNDATSVHNSVRELNRIGHKKNSDTLPKLQEETGNMYANEREQQLNQNNEDADVSEDLHVDNTPRSRMRKNSKYLQNRDRRQVQETTQKDTNVSGLNADTVEISENDEIAIKNQIRELSDQELNELLNSLSEDKRYLLKKIMEESSDDSIMKREITKKAGAGAVEESNCMESGQIDLSETGGVGLSIASSSTDPSDTSNTTEGTQKISTVSPKVDSKIQLTNDDLIGVKADSTNEGSLNSDANLNTAVDYKSQSKEKDETKDKADFKRETNSNEFDNSYNSEEMVCPEDFSEILNGETELTNNRNSYKREAVKNEAEVADAMKSLEESFPNSKSYDEASADPSNMAPLVRVKRKNDELKKRSVNISPSAYNSENEDEDNEEASEFDDEGYNEHLSNLEKNFANRQNDEVSLVEDQPQDVKEQAKEVQLAPQHRCSENAGKNSDAMNLGSDSDNVISGVEGVDENLMYNGASRNKRNMDHFYKPEVDLNRFFRTTSIVDNNLQATAENMQVGSYQESDAFGPLPRNYDSDLGRYKRVRQVKQ